MAWCQHCQDDCETVRDPDRGFLCCRGCGRVLDEDEYDNGPNFEKTGDGQARLSGSIVHSFQSGYSVSRERTLSKGKDEIRNIRYHLQISGEETTDNQAHLFYQIAVDKNFTRGRSTSHVAAACLYIVCRQLKKAYLLIDFTDYLQTNVYVLGAVFLQLCKLLSLDHHPLLQNLVDPSLFIHRFTIGLLNGKKNGGSSHSSEVRKVSETALRIVASMKRDWMQTGRKPSGLCGAALYISALSHGLNYSKSDIVTVVHICEATLTKRLIEFENTESSCLTIEEFCLRADELDKESYSNQLPGPGNLLCTHKDTQPQPPHFAHGLCQECYNEFIKISGGLKDGADPPAFQRAERQRIEKAKVEEKMSQSTLDTQLCDQEHALSGERVAEFWQTDISDTVGCESTTSKGPEGYQAADTSIFTESMGSDNTAVDEEETLSDIDDAEVDGYLHDEEEKRFKTIIWEEMNKEYLEEQAAKEAAAAAGFGSETTAALAKSRRERKQKRAEDARNSNPAQTPAEATSQMLKRKGLSSRINYTALKALYNDEETTKKQKTESDGGDADSELVSTEDAVEDNGNTVEDNDNAEGGGDENYGDDEAYDDGYYEDGGDYDNGDYNFEY